ncbi:hypothetical protein, partial [Rhizobium sp. PDO1-076]|uniref:hypothetical protein n=1 Tax=Rhizobium sp. PDO1-076 TaxID=1125979 RepID=UPI001AEC3329
MGRLKHEALREEVHRFVENQHTASLCLQNTLCCSAAMQKQWHSCTQDLRPSPQDWRTGRTGLHRATQSQTQAHIQAKTQKRPRHQRAS